MTPLTKALPSAAADALLLARRFYPGLDAAAAWLAWQSLECTDDAQRIADFLTGQARRERHAERIDRALILRNREDMPQLDAIDAGMQAANPCDVLEAAQEAQERMQRAGIVLANPDPAAQDTAHMARAHGVTRRRMQQIAAQRRAAAEHGQCELFA